MEKKVYIASVCDAVAFGKTANGYNKIFEATTLTDSGLQMSSSMEEIRAGRGAKLYGRFNHSTSLTVSLTDVMFDRNYITYQVGAKVDHNEGSVLDCMIVDSTTIGTLTDPGFAPMGNAFGDKNYVAWLVCDDKEIEDDYFEANTAAGLLAAVKAATLISGKKYALRYFGEKSGSYLTTIKAAFDPQEMFLVLTGKLYAGESVETSATVGTITFKIPRFQLDGQFDLAMAMTSAANFSLNGTALAVDQFGCESDGVYCEIVDVRTGDNWATGLKAIAIDDDTAIAGATVEIFGLYTDGNTGKLIPDGTDEPDEDTAYPYLRGPKVYPTGSTAAVTFTAYKAAGVVIDTETVTPKSAS